MSPTPFFQRNSMISSRLVTSLGHLGCRTVFWEGGKYFKQCPIVFSHAQHIYPGGRRGFDPLRPLVTDLISSKKFTFDFKYLNNPDFLFFALIINSDESQSKAQINLQSFSENKTGYRAEIISFSAEENFNIVQICLHRFLCPPDNILLCKALLVCYQLFITLMLCYCL